MSNENANHEALRERYLRDPVPVRLGNLASNLARLKSFAQRPEMDAAAARVLAESRHFIDWTQAAAAPAVQAELRELQSLFVNWQSAWNEIWNDAEQRKQLARQAADWSQKILASSGLLR
jgi:hypothetical protein